VFSQINMVNREELLPNKANRSCPRYSKEILELLGIHGRDSDRFLESLPFSLNDITAGSENELQAVGEGTNNNVDLPIAIERSDGFRSIKKRAASGETPKGVMTDLEKFLNENTENVWENSCVRFPRSTLCQFANTVFTVDLRANKKDPCGGLRTDADKFIFHENGYLVSSKKTTRAEEI